LYILKLCKKCNKYYVIYFTISHLLVWAGASVFDTQLKYLADISSII
jgi:hypothetical protein